MIATIDRAVLRKLAEGWKPTMTVEVQVRVLNALLDEHDRLIARVEALELAAEQTVETSTEAG